MYISFACFAKNAGRVAVGVRGFTKRSGVYEFRRLNRYPIISYWLLLLVRSVNVENPSFVFKNLIYFFPLLISSFIRLVEYDFSVIIFKYLLKSPFLLEK